MLMGHKSRSARTSFLPSLSKVQSDPNQNTVAVFETHKTYSPFYVKWKRLRTIRTILEKNKFEVLTLFHNKM